MCSIVWTLQAIPMSFAAIWLYNNYSYSNVLRIASLLQFVGAWFRSVAILTGTFWPILAGTTIQSLSSPLHWQSQNLFINKWMPVNEYGKTSAIYTGAQISLTIGFAIAGLSFSGPEVDVKSRLNSLILVCNFVVSAIFVFFWTTFKHAPDVPPSKVATHDPPQRHLSESFHELSTNRNFQLLSLVYALANSPYSSFGSLLALVFTPFGVSVSQISWLGAIGVIVGAPVAIIFGIYLDRTRAYKKSLTICPIISCLVSIIFPRVLASTPSFATLMTITMVFLSASISIVPLCMAFSVEVTYPLNASLINGTMQIIA